MPAGLDEIDFTFGLWLSTASATPGGCIITPCRPSTVSTATIVLSRLTIGSAPDPSILETVWIGKPRFSELILPDAANSLAARI